MAKKLITVSWAVTVAVNVPKGISDEELLNADFRSRDEVQTVAAEAMQDAAAELNWKDGEITRIE